MLIVATPFGYGSEGLPKEFFRYQPPITEFAPLAWYRKMTFFYRMTKNHHLLKNFILPTARAIFCGHFEPSLKGLAKLKVGENRHLRAQNHQKSTFFYRKVKNHHLLKNFILPTARAIFCSHFEPSLKGLTTWKVGENRHFRAHNGAVVGCPNFMNFGPGGDANLHIFPEKVHILRFNWLHF